MDSKKTSVVEGKRVLITGGTGSFGNILVQELIGLNPKEIVIFSRDEEKQGNMKLAYKDYPLRFVLGDIRDLQSIREAMRGVNIVFHAAALKRIPEVELNVWEGVKTNVVGAQNIIVASREENVEKVVALSTDKAVEPVNAYGMAKALQERLITTANLYDNGRNTVFISTRYGNVLGSRGSVVPLFRSQIDRGEPLTITDASMTRFLLTLKESVQLVLTALEKGVGGEVFVRKMPGHSVGDLADVMLENMAKNKRKVVITGLRPGEKMHEVLVSATESVRTVAQGDYYIILPQIEIAQIEKKYKEKKKLDMFRYGSDTTVQLSKKELKDILKSHNWI